MAGAARCLFPLLVLCSAASCRKQPAAPAAPPPPAVIVAEVTQRDIPLYVELVARTEAAATVEIRARVQGFLVEAPFREGSQVKEGDLLFRIDPQPYRAAIARAEAALLKAEATRDRAVSDVARLQPLAANRAVSQQNLDDAEAATKVAEAEVLAADAALTLAKLDLGYTEMRAPFDGMVGPREVDVGNYVGSSSSTTLLATVSTTDPMRAVIHIAEADYLRYQKRFMDQQAADRHGEEMEFDLILSDGSTYEHKGVFSFVDRTMDARAGTLMLVAAFPNPGPMLRPGQFGRLRAMPEEITGAVLVPQRAVITTQSAQGVLVVGGGNVVEQRPIKTRDRFEDQFIVTEGLQKGDRVIVDGLQKARPGMVVNPVTAPPPER